MKVVTLIDKALDCSTHRDYVVVRVWREYYNALRIWFCTLWTIGIVSIWLTTWPSCDGVLQIVEDLDVGVVS